ncbi:MAG TPA: hypothetical protein VI282_18115, partial [Verrucomicrobiae bacterium]
MRAFILIMQMVASREIRSAARLPRTYWIRITAGAAGVFVLATFGTDDSRSMFFRSVITAFALCLLEGVRLASSTIVDERNEGTLGLLLLTKLRGDELLLGKLAALGFFSLQTLIAVVPVLCVSVVFGGVSAGEIARAALGLAHALLIALTCGLVISARSRTAARAMIKTFFALFAAVFAFSIAWRIGGKTELLFTALNPMTPIWTIPDLEYAPLKTEYWVSVFFSITVALFVLREAGYDLSKYFAAEEATGKEPPQRDEWAEQYRDVVIGKERAQWFSGNPIEWLALRNMGSNSRWRRRIPIVGAVLVSFALLGIRTQAPPWILLIGIVFGFIYS